MDMKLKNVLYSMMAAVTLTAGSASGSTVAGDGGIFSSLLASPIEANVTAASKELFRGADRGDSYIAASVGTEIDLAGATVAAGLTFQDNDASDLETVLSLKATKAFAGYDFSVAFNHYTGNAKYETGLCPITELLHEKELVMIQICRPPATKEDMDDIINAFEKVINHKDELID